MDLLSPTWFLKGETAPTSTWLSISNGSIPIWRRAPRRQSRRRKNYGVCHKRPYRILSTLLGRWRRKVRFSSNESLSYNDNIHDRFTWSISLKCVWNSSAGKVNGRFCDHKPWSLCIKPNLQEKFIQKNLQIISWVEALEILHLLF